MSGVAPHRRPRYAPTERLAILAVRAARGWSLQPTADLFLLAPATVGLWAQRVDEQGPQALWQLRPPVNRFPDLVRYAVQRLKTLCPPRGQVKIAQAACGICGRLFPMDLLVAAHIKRRSECSHEEKLDYRHNVMPMCKFGCDDLFERGYVTVEEGVVRTLPRALASDTVREHVSQLDGRACLYWNTHSVVYFKWQRGHARR